MACKGLGANITRQSNVSGKLLRVVKTVSEAVKSTKTCDYFWGYQSPNFKEIHKTAIGG